METKEITMTIMMKDGTLYEKYKLPSNAFVQKDLITFLTSPTTLKGVPIADVKWFELHNMPENY